MKHDACTHICAKGGKTSQLLTKDGKTFTALPRFFIWALFYWNLSLFFFSFWVILDSCVRNVIISVRAWEMGEMRESHAQCVSVGSPGKAKLRNLADQYDGGLYYRSVFIWALKMTLYYHWNVKQFHWSKLEVFLSSAVEKILMKCLPVSPKCCSKWPPSEISFETIAKNRHLLPINKLSMANCVLNQFLLFFSHSCRYRPWNIWKSISDS